MLQHAYGAAGDVPGLLRELTSESAADRAQAPHKLYGNIFHQGSRYQASADRGAWPLAVGGGH